MVEKSRYMLDTAKKRTQMLYDWDADHKCHCHKLTVKEINEKFQKKSAEEDAALGKGILAVALVYAGWLYLKHFLLISTLW